MDRRRVLDASDALRPLIDSNTAYNIRHARWIVNVIPAAGTQIPKEHELETVARNCVHIRCGKCSSISCQLDQDSTKVYRTPNSRAACIRNLVALHTMQMEVCDYPDDASRDGAGDGI